MVSDKTYDYVLWDEVVMKKPHPCAQRSKNFQILRLGADVKMVCLGCGRIILISRDQFNARFLKVIAHHEGPIRED